MGYVKYKEDDNDAIEERIYNHTFHNNEAIKSVTLRCYYCEFACDTIEGLNQHIRLKHNVLSPVVVVNGKVIHYKLYTKSIIDARIVFFGFTDEVVLVNGINTKYHESDSVDITSILVQNSINTIIIGKDTITIYHLPEFYIRNSIVDMHIDEWEKAISKNQSISNVYSTQLNDAEKFYLNGMFNYYMACISERDKTKRYEDALSILMSFDNKTSVSLCVLRVLAFRLNWVEKLKRLSKGDWVFESVNSFFDGVSEMGSPNLENHDERSLYIETPIEESINAIIEYQNANYESVQKYIDKYPDETLTRIQDSNLKDRILLLKARMARRQGKDAKACMYYKCIKTPHFSLERDQFCLNLQKSRR